MKLSVIIPCHPRNRASLPRTLESLESAKRNLDVEIIVVDDDSSQGPSWARNRGLGRATGDYVFFCDADDTVRPDFLSRPLAVLASTQADFCLFSGQGEIRRNPASLGTSKEVRETYLPAFFGYSNADVRRWNAGGTLMSRKEPGSVCLGAFRRTFLERFAIRFDEAMTMFEDAAFLATCAAFAERVETISDVLYDYTPTATGNMATGWRGRRNWDYKFIALAFRKRLNEKCHGEIWKYCEASCVFSALELLKARYRVREYVKDEGVRAALRSFPLSFRHPLVAAAVLFLRCL